MNNVSGYGLKVTLVASNTFPFGVYLTSFADDADPLDVPDIQIADSAMGLNGDMITWSKAVPIKATLNVIPNSPDDIELAILLEANRVGRGKTGARDEITMSVIYPDNRFILLNSGIITNGMPGMSVSSAGRLKTMAYSFAFESKVGG